MNHVFISYTHQDREAARQLSAELRARGIAVWLDLDSMSAGANWTREVQQALTGADTLVLLLSPDSVESDSVREEFEYATSMGKPVLIMMVRDTTLPVSMRNRQYIDARQNWERAVMQLVDVLSALRPPARSEAAARRTGQTMRKKPSTAAAPAQAPQGATLAVPRTWGWRLLFVLGIAVLVVAMGVLLSALLNSDGKSAKPASEAGAAPTTFAALAPTQPAALAPTQPADLAPTQPAADPATRTAEAREFRATQGHNLTQIAGVAPAPSGAAVAMAASDLALDDALEERVNAQVQVALAGTVVALRATDEAGLSLAEAGQIAALIAEATSERQDIDVRLLLVFNLGLLALALVGGAAVLATRGSRLIWRGGTSHHAARAHPPAVPAPLPEEYQIFISSSDADKAWVGRLVRDLDDLDYQVWWYAKDAPGLPFGQEIVRAIFYAKIFVVIVSPDSMASKHVEEEIRLADRYDRPIITVIYRPTDARLYGLAKSSDIDFSSERDYQSAMDFLTQAINRLLERHRQAAHDEAQLGDGAAPDTLANDQEAVL